MAIKHKHMSETVDDMTTGWRRILIGEVPHLKVSAKPGVVPHWK